VLEEREPRAQLGLALLLNVDRPQNLLLVHFALVRYRRFA
jgi:hypothetical protein